MKLESIYMDYGLVCNSYTIASKRIIIIIISFSLMDQNRQRVMCRIPNTILENLPSEEPFLMVGGRFVLSRPRL